ncbi:MAG: type II secretion system protein [Candidatus Wallbacteria bacterium]|nr:type II secretion system protein [Candidatus Wallbacteria bacterium]
MKKAFSLIELVISITIIGVLSALIVPKVIQYIDDSKKNVLLYNLATIRRALVAYAKDHDGCYPRSLRELVERGYINAIPTDPLTDGCTWEIAVWSPDHKTGSNIPHPTYLWAGTSEDVPTSEKVVPLTMYTDEQLTILGKQAADYKWDTRGICNVRIGNRGNKYYKDSSFDKLSADSTTTPADNLYLGDLSGKLKDYPDYSEIKKPDEDPVY